MNLRHYSIEDSLAPESSAVVRGGLGGILKQAWRLVIDMASLFSRSRKTTRRRLAQTKSLNQVVALRQDLRQWKSGLKKFRSTEKDVFLRPCRSRLERLAQQLDLRVSHLNKLRQRSEALCSKQSLPKGALREAESIHSEVAEHLSVLEFELRMMRVSCDLTAEKTEGSMAVFASGASRQPSLT